MIKQLSVTHNRGGKRGGSGQGDEEDQEGKLLRKQHEQHQLRFQDVKIDDCCEDTERKAWGDAGKKSN